AGAQNGSAIATAAAATVTISAEGTTTLTYFAVDHAGHAEAAKTLTVRIDKTPPTPVVVANPPPNANGWSNTDVTVSFDAVDTLSGVAALSIPVTVTTEGAGQVITGSATDMAGSVTVASMGLNIDKTPPEGWNPSDPARQAVAASGRA